MPLYTNHAELTKIKDACKAAALVLEGTCKAVKAGMTTLELDNIAAELMQKYECNSGCLGYPPHRRGGSPYPGHTCISINDEIVHGIPGNRKIESGDIVSVDVVIEKDGYFGDNARTIPVGTVDARTLELLRVTEESLELGILQAVRGKRVGDIGHVIQKHVEASGFGVVRDFVGHGVGRTMHEEPQILNFGKPGFGEELKVGMVIAIEPMINTGSWKIKYDPDGWTTRTVDGLPSAHFEHTVYISNKGPVVLTRI